jgi:uncharacterized membrane protein YphA (DoxX/SURF4 family)
MNLKRCEAWIQPYRPLFMDLVRIYLGIGLFVKGVFFLLHPEQLASLVESTALAAYAGVVPYVHIVGGLLLATGIFVRAAALAQLPILFGAVFLVHLPRTVTMQMREGLEFSALVLFLVALVFIRGTGTLTLWKRPPMFAACQRWMDDHPDVFMDLIRSYLGVGLFMKGIYIMEHGDQFARVMEQTSGAQFLVMSAAHYVIPAHFAGGLLLAIGLLTRVAALVQLPLLAGAVFLVNFPQFASLELRQNLEFTALVLFLLVLITAHGSGRFSVDHALEKSERARLEPHLAH